MLMVLGVDIGGTHITAALVDEQTASIIPGALMRNKVDSQGSANEIISAWAEAISGVWAKQGISATKVGIAMPGPFDYEQGISLMIGTEKYESIYQMNVRIPLAEKLGIAADRIIFRNDAEAFLLGEMMGGAGKGFSNAIGITLGTGLGAAIYKNGITIDANRWNFPFKDSYFEEYISTRFFVKRYQQLSGKPMSGAREVRERITEDKLAAKVYREFSENLADFIRSFIGDTNPELLVIGGNIAGAWDVFYPALEELLSVELKKTVIRRAMLGEEAALIGGACSWL